MNEFVAKKLGEVLAFTRVGQDTIGKSREALIEAIGVEQIMDMEEKFRIHGEEVLRVATEAGVVDTTIDKANKTEEKIKKMRDLYIGDQWDNATEIMEWTGFFAGAAIVHWALVRGTAEGLSDQSLMILSEEGVNWSYELLERAESELESHGQDKAVS